MVLLNHNQQTLCARNASSVVAKRLAVSDLMVRRREARVDVSPLSKATLTCSSKASCSTALLARDASRAKASSTRFASRAAATACCRLNDSPTACFLATSDGPSNNRGTSGPQTRNCR